MKISIIVAAAENGVIGKDNQLLWKLSSDLKRFKTHYDRSLYFIRQKDI
jgi:dihydrofolate reductase